MEFKAGIYDASGAGITGSADIFLILRSDADDHFYDWDDSTFKASGWVTPSGQLSEINTTIVPGEYEVTVPVSGWNDGIYTAYTKYMGSPAWVDEYEFRVYDGKESVALSDEILADTSELQSLISSDKIAAQVKAIDDIDISDTMKASINIEVDSALYDYGAYTGTPPTTSEIAAALLASTVDGTLDLQDVLKMLLARIPGNQISVSDNVYTFYDQAGAVLFTVTYTPTSTTTTIP